MTHPQPPLPPPPPPVAARWLQSSGQPAGHLVCNLHGQVCWTDAIAEQLLSSAQVVLLQADGRLGVRSHRLGLLALRSAMRLAVLGTPSEPITLRHGRDELVVGVHALPDAADGAARVLLSLRPVAPVAAGPEARAVSRPVTHPITRPWSLSA
jgi:hypothetical protein